MIQNTMALSIGGLMLTGFALAASPQLTAAEDAQFGEVAKTKAAEQTVNSTSAAPEAKVTPAPQGSTASAQTTPTTTSPYSEAELKNFVDAAKGVDQVKLKYEGKLTSAKGEAEINKIKKEADAELSKTVEAKGITVDQYNKIHQSAMQDPQLLSRIQKYM
jgi:hypothetical protein